MLNEDVQAWVDLGFSEEEAIVMANAMKDRYGNVEITDDDSDSSHNELF
ncbi:hypothetical protein [Lacrimispora sp.]|nr:hypothetical protein [Lacrimispora sp.]